MTQRPLHSLAACPDCGSEHLNAPCGMTFIQRMRSVKAATEWMPSVIDSRTTIRGPGNKTDRVYYDDEAVKDLFGYDRKERKEKFLDDTHGVGAIDKPEKIKFPGDRVVSDEPKKSFTISSKPKGGSA